MSYHPSKPNILAVGSFSGEISLYDTSTSEELAKSELDEYFHRESVT